MQWTSTSDTAAPASEAPPRGIALPLPPSIRSVDQGGPRLAVPNTAGEHAYGAPCTAWPKPCMFEVVWTPPGSSRAGLGAAIDASASGRLLEDVSPPADLPIYDELLNELQERAEEEREPQQEELSARGPPEAQRRASLKLGDCLDRVAQAEALLAVVREALRAELFDPLIEQEDQFDADPARAAASASVSRRTASSSVLAGGTPRKTDGEGSGQQRQRAQPEQPQPDAVGMPSEKSPGSSPRQEQQPKGQLEPPPPLSALNDEEEDQEELWSRKWPLARTVPEEWLMDQVVVSALKLQVEDTVMSGSDDEEGQEMDKTLSMASTGRFKSVLSSPSDMLPRHSTRRCIGWLVGPLRSCRLRLMRVVETLCCSFGVSVVGCLLRPFARSSWRRLSTTSIVFHPDHVLLVYWKVIGLFLAVYLFFALPYCMAFSACTSSFAVSIDTTIDMYFMCDLMVNFNTGFKESDSDSVVMQRSSVSWNYLTGWFSIDFVSAVPWDWIVSSKSSGMQFTKAVRVVRISRVLRALKMARVARFKRLASIQEKIDLTIESSPLLMFIAGACRVLLLLSAFTHWSACAWYVVGTAGATDTSWVKTHLDDGADELVRYTYSVYYALTTMTTVGYGDIVPTNINEVMLALWLLLQASVIWAVLMGVLMDRISTLNAAAKIDEERKRVLSQYLNWREVPPSLFLRVREHLLFRWQANEGLDTYEQDIHMQLSPVLRRELCYHIYGRSLRSAPFLKWMHEASLKELSNVVETLFMSRGDHIFRVGEPNEQIYYVLQGSMRLSLNQSLYERVRFQDFGFGGEVRLLEFLGLASVRKKPLVKARCISASMRHANILLKAQDLRESWAARFIQRRWRRKQKAREEASVDMGKTEGRRSAMKTTIVRAPCFFGEACLWQPFEQWGRATPPRFKYSAVCDSRVEIVHISRRVLQDIVERYSPWQRDRLELFKNAVFDSMAAGGAISSQTQSRDAQLLNAVRSASAMFAASDLTGKSSTPSGGAQGFTRTANDHGGGGGFSGNSSSAISPHASHGGGYLSMGTAALSDTEAGLRQLASSARSKMRVLQPLKASRSSMFPLRDWASADVNPPEDDESLDASHCRVLLRQAATSPPLGISQHSAAAEAVAAAVVPSVAPNIGRHGGHTAGEALGSGRESEDSASRGQAQVHHGAQTREDTWGDAAADHLSPRALASQLRRPLLGPR